MTLLKTKWHTKKDDQKVNKKSKPSLTQFLTATV